MPPQEPSSPESVIAVYPTDNAELERILVAIRTEKTGLIERGQARWNHETQRWESISKADAPQRELVIVDVLILGLLVQVAHSRLQAAGLHHRSEGQRPLNPLPHDLSRSKRIPNVAGGGSHGMGASHRPVICRC
jgi:hypothetical protein